MHVEISDRDPAADRLAAMVFGAVLAPVGTAFGIVAAGLLGWWPSLLGWIVVVLATAIGALPLVGQRLRRPTADVIRIDVSHVSPGWRRVLRRAGAATERIARRHETTPDGPLRDHIGECLAAARGHLLELTSAVDGSVRVDHPGTDPAADRSTAASLLQTERAISRLADAVDELVERSRPIAASRLEALIDRTLLLAESLDRVEPIDVSEADRDGFGRARGSDATIDH